MVSNGTLRTCTCLAFLFAACGGGDTKNETPEAEQPAAAADSAPVASAPAEQPVTVEDIGRWQKGMTAELAAVREAGTKLKGARNGEDTLAALMGVQEMTTADAGAKAAGIDIERYKSVRSNLSAAVGYLTPHLGGIDTTMLSPEQREEMRRNNAAQLQQLAGVVPSEVVDALRPKADDLRKQELELAGARLKGAGM